MAAIATDTIEILINDIPIQVPKGELIVESVKRLGLEIPVFCYHPRMKPVGMCRMCIVEVGFKQPDGTIRKMPKPQAGCTLPASEGMAVYTDSEMVHRDRRGVLEFLLINHPLDCPICDRGGECPLQNNTLFYGPSTSRFLELKRHLPKAFPLSKYVTLDLERCIQCGRCVRFTEEISGDAQLAFRFRGASMQPSTFEMRDFESKFSGNVIEICPVGALTSSVYRFRARPWDLETKPGICTVCSNGCNVWFDYRVGSMVRINGRTNEAVNEEWTCDRGKFGHEFYNSDRRLTMPLLRQDDTLAPADWPVIYEEIIKNFAGKGAEVAALGGGESSNEDVYMLQRLFREHFGSNNLDHRFASHLQKHDERLPFKKTPIAAFESTPATLIFGCSLADEEPILFLRVRKGWFHNGRKVVVASDKPTDVDSFAHVVLRYKPGTEVAMAQALQATISLEDGAAKTGVSRETLAEAINVLKGSGAPVVTTANIYNLTNGKDVVNELVSLAKATGGELNIYGLTVNDQGAEELGMLPDAGPGGEKIANPGLNTHQILDGCAKGEIKALWLIGTTQLESYHDQGLVRKALENVDYLVVQAHTVSDITEYASVVLPMTAPAESEGTYTNLERRVQRFRQVLKSKGEAKPAWRVCSEIAVRLAPQVPFFNPAEVMDEIAKDVKHFGGARYPLLGATGIILD